MPPGAYPNLASRVFLPVAQSTVPLPFEGFDGADGPFLGRLTARRQATEKGAVRAVEALEWEGDRGLSHREEYARSQVWIRTGRHRDTWPAPLVIPAETCHLRGPQPCRNRSSS